MGRPIYFPCDEMKFLWSLVRNLELLNYRTPKLFHFFAFPAMTAYCNKKFCKNTTINFSAHLTDLTFYYLSPLIFK